MIQQFTDASFLNNNSNDEKFVILFTAEWHEACAVGGPMDQLLTALAATTATATSNDTTNMIQFGRCVAEENPILTERYGITAVPTFCFILGTATVIERIVGGDDPASITTAVQRLMNMSSTATANSEINEPSLVQKPPSTSETLTQRLDRMIRSSPVMIFIKGTPTQPKCGFSRQIVEILQQENIPFASFDILSDERVRQGLKVHSNWPTYPQIYVNGELMGGLDIVQELRAEGSSLAEQWNITPLSSTTAAQSTTTASDTTTTTTLEERIKQLIHRSPIMLFMKGVPSAPKCGFSRQIVQLLENELNVVSYDAYDILTNEEMRQGIKDYSNWPTYPQLYIHGELIGGLDIVQEMSQDGTLQDALRDAGMMK